MHACSWISLALGLLCSFQSSHAFVLPTVGPIRIASSSSSSTVVASSSNNDVPDMEYLKAQLLEYLEKRREVGADELAQKEIGKVIGGTKGNAVLDFVSGSPNKEKVLDKAPDALDYGELNKYGFGHLVTPIMKAGGRFEMYRMLELEAPETRIALKRLSTPKLVIDREGKNDPTRYTGLKLGQVLDDSAQAAALEATLKQKREEQEALEYEMPFADKRNVSPKQTPDWTPERLDEWGMSQGRVEAWARRAKAGEFVNDPDESPDLTLPQRAFSIFTILLIATAFGKSTDSFLVDLVGLVPDKATATTFKETLQAPAIGLFVASIGSLVLSYTQAGEQNRNPTLWAVKGLLGGPFTVALLQSLDPLITREEEDAKNTATP